MLVSFSLADQADDCSECQGTSACRIVTHSACEQMARTHLLEGLRQALVLLGNLKHQLLVLAVLLLHLSHILLERFDQVQVVVRDVVIIVLDVCERLRAL